jgi:hypothetical protein
MPRNIRAATERHMEKSGASQGRIERLLNVLGSQVLA